MVGLTDLEVYNSVFIIKQEKNLFELYTDTFDERTITELKDDLEDNLNVSDIPPEDIEDDRIGPLNIKAFRKKND